MGTTTLPRMSDSTIPDPVLYERRDPGIALLTLNRPERLNAWNGELAAKYFELLDRAAADPEVKVIVVTGAGKGFCAGADMDTLQAIGGDSRGARRALRVAVRSTTRPLSPSRSSPPSTARAPASAWCRR